MSRLQKTLKLVGVATLDEEAIRIVSVSKISKSASVARTAYWAG
jgi:hypothetical protein